MDRSFTLWFADYASAHADLRGFFLGFIELF
jgi:hypothetical protein